MKIIVGLSGGVDSSVAALLLKNAGHEVIGCFMRSFDTDKSETEQKDAEKIADKLGIKFVVSDYRKEFKKDIIDYFSDEYIHGRTPNPCVICNRKIKWEALLDVMKSENADMIATGHYSRIADINGRLCIRVSEEREKDQSYVLFGLTKEQLSHAMFPLSGMKKEDVRKIAEDAGLFTSDKPDSQEICFIPDNDYNSFLKKLLPELPPEGNYVNQDGEILGKHCGITNYTIGQRKGLGIALGKRVFVKEIRPDTNEVVLADDSEVFSDKCFCNNLYFQGETGEREFDAVVRVRYAHKGEKAHISFENTYENGTELIAKLQFEKPVRAVTPGQFAVFYNEDGCVLGGGKIIKPR